VIAWLRWWLVYWRAAHYVYVTQQRGDPMAIARATIALERARILRP